MNRGKNPSQRLKSIWTEKKNNILFTTYSKTGIFDSNLTVLAGSRGFQRVLMMANPANILYSLKLN